MQNNIEFKYSVLMSVYFKDNSQWLKESIESMLNQTIMPDEFVIVKDGKLNIELDNIISGYVLKYPDIFKIISLEKNQGLGPALAVGIEQCKNEWIARMDSDDISKKDRIEKEYNIIKNRDVDIVGSSIAEFIENIENVKAIRKLPETDAEIKKFAKRRNPFGHPSVILRKSKVIEAGNFRSYYLCEDYDMWVRMIEKDAKCYNIQENLVYMRISEDFYKRRGGIKYLKSILKFKKEQYNKGFFSFKDFLITSGASFLVCLAPNQIREKFYKKILRKDIKNNEEN